ncbi:hypothetical protein ACQE30_02150 [Staphylococcus cohnii]|uniref:DUF805 domain-containing protein n=2 Tax=Staphylococcus cohnii TaxID=29382 RepID=A0ABT6IYS3_9STAP|nr:hypothetical protein [Staphylococcus cohnii]KKI65302.1 hypothetical protein UF66_1259 [Staphylococcus cohnii subsp. cohnii]MCI2941206.1 hypothetical protein [Staphylococcus cohnii]MDE1710437.1 hypothetical protein [Staphylococcus cohnii]MDH5139774.1 hypothetical protein [Staphylococcus cohnii]MDH5157655.1 hypothetical protein [Staphylococcus cohnii]
MLFPIGSYTSYSEGIFFNSLEGVLGIGSIIFFILNIVAFFYMITDSDKAGNQYGLPRK